MYQKGITVAGSGLGNFMIAPLVSFLIQEYGWRGTLMVLSGIMLNCALFGALFAQNHSREKQDICSYLLQFLTLIN